MWWDYPFLSVALETAVCVSVCVWVCTRVRAHTFIQSCQTLHQSTFSWHFQTRECHSGSRKYMIMGYTCTSGENCIAPPIWWMKHERTPLFTSDITLTERWKTSELLRVQPPHCQDWWFEAWEFINNPHQSYVKVHQGRVLLIQGSASGWHHRLEWMSLDFNLSPFYFFLVEVKWYIQWVSFLFAFPLISPFSSQQEMIYSHVFCWFKRRK